MYHMILFHVICYSLLSHDFFSADPFLNPAGYEVYLVGGCVRDLIVKRTPKDFDIITSAELKEVFSCFFLFVHALS